MANTIKGETGDGLRLHQAVKLSDKRADEIFTLMGISNGTLYRYFKEPVLSDDAKQAAAKALGRSVEDIFAPVKNTPTDNSSIDISSQLNNSELDMNQIMKMMADDAEAARKDAEARLRRADVLERLTSSLGITPPKAQAS